MFFMKRRIIICLHLCLILAITGVSALCGAQQETPAKSAAGQGMTDSNVPDVKTDDGQQKSAERLVAVGDGFRVTESDVAELTEFASKKKIRTTDEEYRRGAVKLRLFALEAKNMGLVDSKDAVSSFSGDDMSVEEMMKCQGKYFYFLYEGANVSDSAVRSYYLSHPKTFRKEEEKKEGGNEDSIQAKESSSDTFVGKEDMMPLDEKIKKRIRLTLVKANWAEIEENAYKDLVAKYHVRFCHKEKCE